MLFKYRPVRNHIAADHSRAGLISDERKKRVIPVRSAEKEVNMSRKNRNPAASETDRQINEAFSRSQKTAERIRTHMIRKQEPDEIEEYLNHYRYFDRDDGRMARRMTAARKYYEQIRRLVEDRCPEIILRNSLGDSLDSDYTFASQWGDLNANLIQGYDDLNNKHYLTLAAAIWILDRIEEYSNVPIIGPDGEEEKDEYDIPWNRRARMMTQLPMDGDCDDLVELPEIFDPCNDEAVLYELVYLIENRNGDRPKDRDQAEKDRNIRERYARERRPLLDPATVEGCHPDTENRRAFDKVLSLIPQRERDRAASRFEELMWDWTEKFFNGYAAYTQRAEELNKKIRGTKAEMDQLVRLMDPTANAGRSKSGQAPRPASVNPLLMKDDPKKALDAFMSGGPAILPGMMSIGDRFSDPAERFERLMRRQDDLIETLESTLDQQLRMPLFAGKYFTTARENLVKELQGNVKNADAAEKMADAFSGVTVEDPYELCFGLLALIDSGSDLPWLYFPGVMTAQLVASRLPWFHEDYDETDDPVWNIDWAEEYSYCEDIFQDQEEDDRTEQARGEGDREQDHDDCSEHADLNGEIVTPANKAKVKEILSYVKYHRIEDLPKYLRAPTLPDWYALNYGKEKARDGEQVRKSLAQIVYEQTGAIMPRKLDRYRPVLRELAQYGIMGQKAYPLEMIMLLLGESRMQTRDWRSRYIGEPDVPEEEIREAEPQTVEDPEMEKLRAELRAAKRDLARMRENVHDALKEAREERRKSEKILSETESEKKELHALREILFERENEAGQQVTEPPDLPGEKSVYTVQRKMVVFGGHDSWLRAIKPMLNGNIRFIDRDMRPNADIIRNAGIVWIQANCIGHDDYYKIIDVVRGAGKRVEYFRCASAWKCVQQIMTADR